jgi:hypothetical protein
MKRAIWIAAVAAAIAFGIWWPLGGQGWLAIHTGTDYCAAPATTVCRSYGFWSGFGSVFPWSVLTLGGVFAGIAAGLRAINCHEKGCPRIGRYPVAGGRFKYCGMHHPDWKGKHPPREHILSVHAMHLSQTRLLNEIHKHVSAMTPRSGDFPPEPKEHI